MATENRTIDLSKLKFDPKNPRLPKNLIGEIDERLILDHMLRNENVYELMLSIGEAGYSNAEPLLVVPDNNNSEYYIVVEGNRRLAALKLLNNPKLATIRRGAIQEVLENVKFIPTTIPVIIYSSREDVLDYLGYRHITGVKDWGPLEKARYLDQLYQRHIQNNGSNIYSVLAKMIGSRPDYVGKLHTSLKLYDLANNEAYFGADIKEESIDFSWYPTALSYKDTVTYLGLLSPSDSQLTNLNLKHYEKLFNWLFVPGKRKVEESRDISDLNKVLANPSALERLDKGYTLDEALLFTSAPNDSFLELLGKAKMYLLNSKSTVEQLNSIPDGSMLLLDDMEKIIKSIRGSLESNFGNKSDEIKGLTPDMIEKLKALLEKQG